MMQQDIWLLTEDDFLKVVLKMHSKSKHDQVNLLMTEADQKNFFKSRIFLIKALHVWGDSLISSKSYETAVSCYNKLLLIDKDPVALTNRGLALWEMGKLNDALKDYLSALKIDPTNKVSLRGAGAILDELERSDEALDILFKAVKIDPNYSAAWTSLGIAYFNCEKWKEAYNALKIAVSINPNDCVAQKGISKIESHFEE